MLIILSVGGSILAKELKPESFLAYADALREISKEHDIIVVTGGGVAARDYINVARSTGSNEVECDYIGIDITRLNAKLLISALGDDAYPRPPLDYVEARDAFTSGKIIVMGGVIPGQTTDAVAAILAEYMSADMLVIATAVDGVYTADPREHPDAKKYDTMTCKELVNTVIATEMKAGSKSPVDPLAAKIIERCNLETIVMDGTNASNVRQVIMQESLKTEPLSKVHLGTRIKG
ncbi:UMP kinase [Methanolobus zinderi]|jgi:uridylate kinase|uniref:Uridylate kinase n=1 Tax=Methanolobus zinderi TaxID=536044 RepID=A0A7D5I6C4_9EURY|nr:UMP kinase [Methanolobus zinderi]KXS44542.1 MAG: uridylate kinase [Methanolobus sp. T82-4]QLC51001.1 UMP kinase [Methanolobus zinderi]